MNFSVCFQVTNTPFVGTSENSDWSEKSVLMVVYEKEFFNHGLDRKFWQNFSNMKKKQKSQKKTLKLFSDQSEFTKFPTGCNWDVIKTTA